MSERIRAGDILNEAFQFGFYRWTTVFRFAWLPVVMVMLLAFGATNLVFDMEALKALEGVQDPALSDFQEAFRLSMPMAALTWIGVGVIALFLYSGFAASIYRLVALGEERSGVAHLRLDGPALRVFFAMLILNGINYVVISAVSLLMLALNGHGIGDFFAAWPDFFAMVEASSQDSSYQPSLEEAQRLAPIGLFFLGFMFALPALIYINVKLAPFAPGSASENRLLLFGAFRMTFGHAWSIFGVYVLFFMAMLVMTIVYWLTMSFLGVMTGLGGSAAVIGKLFGAIEFAASFAYQIFIFGVQFSLQAIIYRRLKTGQ
ncbi:hypothetical protein [Hyphococcus luteus]|uniref:Uncharacterized protein n=1 Tax=Hyphococcus luteus TaxID=2058213 RepID=A0A2S7K4X4_9PROT|nr:hypothetical protein [Marinicaulis flavus]PQA87531.1 hypothetical protein CW354_12075 [Marinicaulis flavus]